MKYRSTPVIQIKNELFEKKGIELTIKREDLNHPLISGNKWWKLKYNIEEAVKTTNTTLLTFGGAYSNHLYATAAAANELGLQCIGIVRGEEVLPLNATLAFCKAKGMQLHYISRERYRQKDDGLFLSSLQQQFGDFYLIPEGGTNELAIKGCEEWAQLINEEVDFDYLCLSVGTGGTLAGMINQLKDKSIVGFSSLKGGEFLIDNVKKWVNHDFDNCRIETQYHFGGYGKVNDELQLFINEFENEHHVPLDPIYTSKMMYGIFDLINRNEFEPGAKILALHTGGMQGRAGFNF